MKTLLARKRLRAGIDPRASVWVSLAVFVLGTAAFFFYRSVIESLDDLATGLGTIYAAGAAGPTKDRSAAESSSPSSIGIHTCLSR